MNNTTTTNINVPFPEGSNLHLKLGVGACRIQAAPGSGAAWVAGTYTDPTGSLPLKLEQEGQTVRIGQEYRTSEWWNMFGGPTPHFELELGKGQPYALTIETGASESRFDLGGLPLVRLLIKQGAGKAAFEFSAPNPQVIGLLDVDAGAVELELKNLANAGLSEMTLDGGAAGYKLDFGGVLQHDGHVRVNTGMSSVEITVPASLPAKMMAEAVLGGLNIGEGFTKKEGAYWTAAAVAGKTPVLTIDAHVALGSLVIRAT